MAHLDFPNKLKKDNAIDYAQLHLLLMPVRRLQSFGLAWFQTLLACLENQCSVHFAISSKTK